MSIVIRNAKLPNRAESVSILIEGDRISKITSDFSFEADKEIDAKGCLVLPTFVEPHIHLDKVLLSEEFGYAYSIGQARAITVILPDEVITSVEIPQAQGVSSYWMRVAKRNENVISVVSVAVASELKGNDFGISRIALGAVAPTPILAKKGSEKLTGSPITEEAIDAVAKTAGDESRPITDVRASAEYRKQLVRVLTKRSIKKVVNIARGIEL